MVVAILGVAFVFTLPDRASGFFAAGCFFSSLGFIEADGDVALMVRDSLVLGFAAVDLVGRGSFDDAGKSSSGMSNPGMILSTSSSVSSSASRASIGCSVGALVDAEALLETAGDSTTGVVSCTTSGS